MIEVGSGMAVDVVFTEGFYLDGFKLSASGSRENAEADFDVNRVVLVINFHALSMCTHEAHMH